MLYCAGIRDISLCPKGVLQAGCLAAWCLYRPYRSSVTPRWRARLCCFRSVLFSFSQFLAKVSQPRIEVFSEIPDRATNFDKRWPLGAVLADAIHPRLSEKRLTHADVLSSLRIFQYMFRVVHVVSFSFVQCYDKPCTWVNVPRMEATSHCPLWADG